MTPQETLARVIARDCRYTIEAYIFVFESLDAARARKLKTQRHRGRRGRPADPYSQHVTGQEVCEGARRLALEQYGMLAPMTLAQWGIHSTSDLGEIVYNLIATGDMDKTPSDSRADFDDVYDFASAFQPDFDEDLDEPTLDPKPGDES
jgi:uncharacterized repeat protein (TIGR04138 family)